MMRRKFTRAAAVFSSVAALGLGVVTTGEASAASAPDAGALPAAFSSCLRGDFCAWSGPNGTGTKKAWYKCQSIGRPFETTNGSYYNNQTGGAVAELYYVFGGSPYPIDAGEHNAINWNDVRTIQTC